MAQPSSHMDQSPPSEDTLFAHAEWVQGVVKAMVRDEHLAQDIAQDALEAGLKAGPKKIRDPRAWLMGVVRNLHRQDARSGIRRRGIEERKQHKTEEPSSAELLERLEVQQIVARAVMELPDPFRSVLILRFYEGAPIRVIAARRNIAREKAESQVRRGLTLLHRLLKGRLGDTWAVAVLPLALPATASTVTTTAVSLAGAASTKALTGLAACILAWIGFSVWGGSEKPGEVAIPDSELSAELANATAELPSDALAAEAEIVPAQSEQRTAIEVDPMGQAGWVVRGLLTDGEIPAAHARVVLEMRAGQDSSSLVLHEAPLVSDADGRVAWSGEPPETAIYLQLRSADPEQRPSRSAGVLVLPGSAPPQDLHLKFHTWPRVIHGLVTSIDGKPIAGASVRTAERIGETDEDGRFQLPAAPYGSSDFVYAQAPGFAQLWELAHFEDDAAEINFKLPEEILVRGRVVDQNGDPLHGVVISKLHSRWQSASTGYTGEFELGNLKVERSGFDLYARKPGYAPSKVVIRDLSAGSATEVDIVMSRGGVLQGYVTDEDGAPIAAAKITVSNAKHRGDSQVAYSTLDGSFALNGLVSGSNEVQVERLGFASIRRVIEMGEIEGELYELPIQLQVGREIAVTVLDEFGDPLEGGWASALRREDAPRMSAPRTGVLGQTVLSNIPRVTLDLEIGRPGFGKAVLSVGPEQDEVEVRLVPTPTLRGVVLDALTGEPVPEFKVQLAYVDSIEGQPGVSGISMELKGGRDFQSSSGEWEIRYDLDPEHWLSVYIIAEGYTLHENLRVQVPRGGQALSLVSNLERGIALTGVVATRSGGAPIAGAKLTWVDPGGVPTDLQMNVRNPSTTTDERGRFELTGIPAGESSFVVEHKNWARHIEGPILFTLVESAKQLQILLSEAVTLSGSVLAANGAPMSAVRITATEASSPGPSLNLSSASDADGRFIIDGLPIGSYQVHAEAQTNGTWWTVYRAENVDLREGGLDLTIRRSGTARILGRIAAAADLPEVVSMQAVKLDGEGQGAVFGGLAINGTFEINNLPPGLYRVELGASILAAKAAAAVQSVTLELADNQSAEVELKMTFD